MFKNFAIPDCFDIPIEVKTFLAKLWNKSYSELYDEEFFDEIHLTEGELEQDTIKLLRILEDKKREDLQYHLIYLNWSLCLACKPTIDPWRINNQDEISPSNFVLDSLKKWSLSKSFDSEFTNFQINIDDYFGIAGEAVMVYQNILKIPLSDDPIILVADSIDSCVEGTGILPGSEDRRAIFNWLLTDVFPAAYCKSLPTFIYTKNFRLEPNWKYNKYVAEDS